MGTDATMSDLVRKAEIKYAARYCLGAQPSQVTGHASQQEAPGVDEGVLRSIKPYLGRACFPRFGQVHVVPHRPKDLQYRNTVGSIWSSISARLRELAMLVKRLKEGRTKNLEATQAHRTTVLKHLSKQKIPHCVTQVIQHHVDRELFIK